MQGVITSKDEERVVLQIKDGTITLLMADLEWIVQEDEKKNAALVKKWDAEKEQDKKIWKMIYEKKLKKDKETRIGTASPVNPVISPYNLESGAEKAAEYKPGAITTVGCRDGAHSYAVCLPPDYSRRMKCPVLFCFDPGGTPCAGHGKKRADSYGSRLLFTTESRTCVRSKD